MKRIKELHEEMILKYIISNEPVDRRDIVMATGFSYKGVTEILFRLVKNNMVYIKNDKCKNTIFYCSSKSCNNSYANKELQNLNKNIIEGITDKNKQKIINKILSEPNLLELTLAALSNVPESLIKSDTELKKDVIKKRIKKWKKNK